MNDKKMTDLIGNATLSIVDAMSLIDKNAQGLIFIVDEQNKLIGSLTDGDIRRWILSAGDLSAVVTGAMNRCPIALSEGETADAYSIMRSKRISAIPIINRERMIIDIILLSEAGAKTDVIEKQNLSGVPAVVMAGGKGTRLYPYTKILPKPLIPIGETPIIERIMDRFAEYGINRFFMTVNYKKGMICSYFNEIKKPYSIEYIEEEKPLGTGGSIKLIEEKLKQPLFVINCDALILADYGDIYDYHKKSGNTITMVAALKNITIPYGVVKSGENGEVLKMEEKPKLSYFINTGMYVINPETIELIPDDVMYHMPNLVEEVMKNGGKVGTYPISEDSFLDMGEFDEMKRMEQKLNVISEMQG